MDSFESIGVRVETSRLTETLEIGGMKSTKEFAVHSCILPRAPKVKASFSKEGLGAKVIKVFKKELQVGDKTFDDAVYVSTDTPEETSAFLRSNDIQTTILMAVMDGGSIEIDGTKLRAKIPWGDTKDNAELFRFVQTLLG
jgi:hypothetical protein